jgi:carbon monoxide dehydrogenase subunit G
VGRPGRITGEAQITLEEETEGTYLTYSADVKIRGAAARVGSRLLTAAVRSMARQFFDAIEVQAKTATEAGA